MHRVLEFDLARSLCVLWIVGFWHLYKWLYVDYHLTGVALEFSARITMIVLGTFTFISGCFLQKYTFSCFHDIYIFAQKRISRFYLLLFMSTASLFALGWISLSQSLQILTGTNMFWGTPALTLWYFSMMILFYLLTPLLSISNTKVSHIIAIVLFLLLLLLAKDNRVLWLFPMYYLGLKTPQGHLTAFLKKKYTPIVFIILTIVFIIIDIYVYHITLISDCLIVLIGTLGLLAFCLNCYPDKMTSTVIYISTASMVAYLFHRQIFIVGNIACNKFGCSYMPLFVALSLLLLTFVLSYYVQIYYSKFAKN